MPKESYKLKKTLERMKSKYQNEIIHNQESHTLKERIILNNALADIEEIIEICKERNRF